MIEIGQYHSAWPDWHLGPEQAIIAHQMVRGRVLLPMHWGLYALAYHSWTEPIERALAAAEQTGAILITPPPGQSIQPTAPLAPVRVRWWPAVPWIRGEKDPIISTQMN